MTRRSKPRPRPDHPLAEHWDDERGIGNGIIVTLLPGHLFYDDCGVMGFDTVREARDAIREVAARSARLGDGA
ncbi:MAG: hypothetical protein KAF42_12300 [Sphingopyxis terrae]|nr:hypothetical protein [Sphingopyxis terrae]